MEEVWKDIKGYENLYQVSNFGRVRSLGHYTLMKNGRTRYHKGKIIIPHHYSNGYLFVCLSKNGIHKQILLHRLVLITFVEKKSGYEVNHIDENKENNRLDNLEWVTHKYNCQYGTRNIRAKENSDFSGEKNPMFGKSGELNPRSQKVFALLGDWTITFPSVKFAARHIGMSPGYMGNVVAHKRPSNRLKGLLWYNQNNFPSL